LIALRSGADRLASRGSERRPRREENCRRLFAGETDGPQKHPSPVNLSTSIFLLAQIWAELMDWGHVVRNTAVAIGITFVVAIGTYLAIRLFVSVL
jgi:hypothetical protein